jgi:type IV pilus assembly protein PilV
MMTSAPISSAPVDAPLAASRVSASASAPRGGRLGRPTVAGYTLIEVMMAVAVLTAGAAGILALQSAATSGNAEAREMTIAVNATRTWVERIKRDALGWNTPSTVASAALLSNTVYLRNVPAPGAALVWNTPVPPAGESYAFDHFGREVLAPAAAPPGVIKFCTQYRLAWVQAGRTIRADVRTWWPRRGATAGTVYAERRNCGLGDEGSVSGDPRVRIVAASTLVRWTAR